MPNYSKAVLLLFSLASIIDGVSGNRNRKLQQTVVKEYELFEAETFPQLLTEWEEDYPDLIQVTTAQEAYGLPAAGGNNDCPFYEEKGCPNYFFTIQDFIAHPIGSETSNLLPEMIWSGCLHGNERVGPTSVMEASAILLEAAYCEGLPRDPSEIDAAKECRSDLNNKGIDDVQRKWLARLVSTRRIVVVPTANALGYYRNTREEGTIDPNRDFPYDLTNYDTCMQSITARTLNEIYLDHMFQLAFTFHGGIEGVYYEWGNPSFYNFQNTQKQFRSPDDEAQDQISRAYSDYGDKFEGSKNYEYGTSNDLLYFVRGGMEDWAYAGSWTPELTGTCTPKQFGGYPPEKTQYSNSTLRAFNILVETSWQKEPTSNIGNSFDVLNKDTPGNGHVSRNIRLSLLSAELVEPYAGIVGVNELALTDDIVPMTSRDPESCFEDKAVMVAGNAESVDIEWTVGGGLTIKNTKLWYAKLDDVSDNVKCWTQPTSTQGLERAGKSFSGTGAFSPQGANPSPAGSITDVEPTVGPLFRASVPLENFNVGDKILVLASAKVDPDWKEAPTSLLIPELPPQSHVANARTDPNYFHETNGKKIQGRLQWFSVPLTIVIGEFDENERTVVELNPRFPPDVDPPQDDCEDNADPFLFKGTETTCQELADISAQKREKKCDKNKYRKNCPGLCKEAKCPCANSKFPFIIKGETTSCDDEKEFNETKRGRRCDKFSKIRRNCRGLCNPENCPAR